MKSRLEEDLRIGDLEGSIMDKFQVDSFQPKFCDEKDVAVVAFLVTQKESAVKLGDYITQGPFNFLNVEASSSPDESGSYVVLAELDRSQEMFNTIDQLLHYIDQQVHIRDWYFKPYRSDKHLPWNRENFIHSVPQDPKEFQSGKNGDSKESKPAAESTPAKIAGQESDRKAEGKTSDIVNYSLLARIVEREISKSSRSYFVEFQKQFRKVSKDNRRLLNHFREIKTDHQQLVKQLDLHQRREKLALMREQQDIKRIRNLEDRLTYLLFAGPEKREISVSDASTPAIAIEPADVSTSDSDTEAIVEPQVDGAGWAPDTAPPDGHSVSTEAAVEEAEILPAESEASVSPTGDETAGEPAQAESKATGAENEGDGGEAESALDVDQPAAPEDDSPLSNIFREAMEASEQKNYPKAIEGFTRITEMSPDEPRAFYNLAILHFRLADYEKAEQCARAAIDLGADGARKVLKKARARKSGRSGRKAGSAGQENNRDEKNPETDQASRRQNHSPVGTAEDPLASFEQSTVEIDRPPFTATDSPDGEKIQAAFQNRDLQGADKKGRKKEEPPPFGTPGSDDTIFIDPEALAAVEQNDEAQPVVESAGPGEIPAEVILPADETAPTIDEEPFDVEDMPTASLDDFIQAGFDEKQVPVEESVVEEVQPQQQPPGLTSGEAYKPVTPKAATVLEEAGASAEAPTNETAAVSEEEKTEVQPGPAVEVPPESTIEVLPDSAVEAPLESAAEAPPVTTPEAPAVPMVEVQTDEVKEAESSKAPDVRLEEDSAEQGKKPPVVEAELFARALAASQKKNYAEALQLFTRFVELNPEQPRGYYNLAILHYRLKDFETSRDMARKALDMGIGSAQKVYEKSQIRLAKERSVSMDSVESASTDTIFEELDTAAFESIDPSALEEIPVAESLVEPPPPAAGAEQVSAPPVHAGLPAPPGDESEIELSAPAETGPAPAGDSTAEGIPEFPVLTGDFVQQVGVPADDAVVDPAAENIPEIDAMPIPDPAAKEGNVPAGAEAGETKGPMAPPDARPEEKVVESLAGVPPESETAAPEAGERKDKPPAEILSEAKDPVQAEVDPDKAAEALFAEGMKAYAGKNLDQAIEIFNRFISLRPREPRGYYNLAIVYYRRKDYPAARTNAEKALKLGARAAKKVLQKIKKKQLESKSPSARPAVGGKKRHAKRPATGKPFTTGAGKQEKKPAAAQPPEPAGTLAAAISAPEPVESPDAGEGIGDISDYDTATFDIAEVLGHDPVVWDADDMEEEVDTSEIQPPLTGDETKDDVIVFESATPAKPARSTARPPGGATAGSPDIAERANGPERQSDKKAKAGSVEGGDIPGSDMFALGLAASEKKEYLKAIRYFKKFTEMSPNDPRGYYNLAVVSYRLKSYETAREHAKRAQTLGSKQAAKILAKLKSTKVAA